MDAVKEYLMILKDDLLGFVKAGTALDPTIFMGLVAIILVWLLCACFASSIAEKKGYSARSNFVLGLLLPMAYPIILVLKMPKHQVEAEARLDAERAKDAEMKAQEAADVDEELISLDVAAQRYDQAYFDQLVLDTEGELTLRMNIAGNVVNVQKVIDCLDNVLVAEIVDEDRAEKTLRIPYAKIEQCDPL